MPLGRLLGTSKAVLDGLGPPKSQKTNMFFIVFANVGFRYFGGLDGPLGPILAPLGPVLGPIWPPKVVQKWTKNCLKYCLKIDPKIERKITLFGPVLSPKMRSKHKRGNLPVAACWSSWPQVGPKMAPRCPKIAPRWPKIASRWSR